MLYFFDPTGRYIGCRERRESEAVPDCATETPVIVSDGHEAHFDGVAWTVTEVAPAPEPHEPELTDIEKLKIRQDATEDAILFLMDMGGMA